MKYDEITRAQEKLIEKSQQQYMIGRLRSYNPIQLTQNGDVTFYIEPLCDSPKAILDIEELMEFEQYVGIDRYQEKSVMPYTYDCNSYDVDWKLEEMEEHFQNKLVIFKPTYTCSRYGKWFKNISTRLLVDDNLDRYNQFSAVPRVTLESNKFEQLLKKGEFFDLPEFDGQTYDFPEIIICGAYAYRLKDPRCDKDLVIPNENAFERWKCTNIEDVVKIELSKFESFKTDLIKANDNIFFMEDCLKQQILLSDNYTGLDEDKSIKPSLQDIDKTIEADNYEEEPQIDNKEVNFLKGLQQLTINKGLTYEFSDLVNFHTSLKTNSLTILAGMSGTGKTQLAYNYAKMLNLSEDNDTLLFMPISPSYTEPNDVLGYLNSMNGLYVPSETGFVKFLQHASQNPEQMHMVIFDEMNLSQVEYWFSPFISILEKDVEERHLHLYDGDAHCINKKVYPDSIKIGENILFVGTVNIDDTTKDFSDRLLDRTFVISLQKVNFQDYFHDFIKNSIQNVDVTTSKCENVSEFMRWNKSDNRNYITAFDEHQTELEFLDELNLLIQRYIPNGGISYRVLKNIGNYINNIPLNNVNNMIVERTEVFDTIINQTIMTKIRGTGSQLASLIGIYDEETKKVESSQLIELLDKYQSLSQFKKVRNCIRNKAEDLRINGYTN